MKTALVATLALTGLLVAANGPAVERGVAPDSILLGQACALEGPAAALGRGMRLGLEVFFEQVNKIGGVGGRRIELESVDDGYVPDRTARVTRRLIDRDEVFLLIGGVGTPTSRVAVPIAEANGVPFIAPFTGAEFLRNPHSDWVVNLRGSYFEELEQLARYLVDVKGLRRIACFYQGDDYGQAGLRGIEQALERRGLELCATGSYERNTKAVAKGLVAIAPSEPEAVILVGAYEPCAAFIKTARVTPGTERALFCNISFVGTKALLRELGPAAEGCVTSQVVPFPWDTSIPLVAEYTDAMNSTGHGDEIGFVTLEGYMAAKFFCQVVESVGGELTRGAFLRAVKAVGTFDLGGVTLRFGARDNRGQDQVYLTVFRGGEIQPLEID